MIGGMVRRRAPLATLGVTVLLASVAAGCGGSSSSTSASNAANTTANFDGARANSPKPAPPLKLNNYLGQPVNLTNYRGNAALVLFIYDHCPDICPLIVSNLHAAQNQMSAAERKQMQIIAVSVDPKGDTPQTVKKFLADHQMTGPHAVPDRLAAAAGERVVELEHRRQARSLPKEPRRGRALGADLRDLGLRPDHDALPGELQADQIVHDVPLLASS